ncbi:MAG: thioredoxin family protein [Victivallaceae bacterium]|nr:thioredoxin family protein [Victivallaceae bacterium]
MKQLIVVMFVLSLGISVFAGEWLTDMDQAMKLSAQTGKPVLADFSGSDWCGWCVKMDKEVFSQKIFKDFAKENLILVLVDFPSRKPMSKEQKKANRALAEKYQIKGYPTVLLLDSKGAVIAKTNYFAGGAKKYVDFLKGKLPAGKTAKK